MKKIAATLLMIATTLTFLQCSKDKGTNPDGNSSAGIKFTGITLTNDQGDVLGGDTTDWCPDGQAVKGQIPDHFAVYPAYPNPADSVSTVKFDLPAAASARVFIIDSTGTTVRMLLDESLPAGTYEVKWDLKNDAGNLLYPDNYRCIVDAGDFSCYGDIAINPNGSFVIVYAVYSGGQVTVSYKSTGILGGLRIGFPISGSIGTISYGVAANDMLKGSYVQDDTLFISCVTDYPDITTMPSDSNYLCTFSYTGSLYLDLVDASDTLGQVVRGYPVNSF